MESYNESRDGEKLFINVLEDRMQNFMEVKNQSFFEAVEIRTENILDEKSQKQQVIEENISEQQIIEKDISAKIIIDNFLFVLSMESQSTVQAGGLLCTHCDVIRQEVSEMDTVRAFVEVNYNNTAEVNQKSYAEDDCIQNAEIAQVLSEGSYSSSVDCGGTI
jgi:hypothetical protein